MPMYDFKCSNCGITVEVIINAGDDVKCLVCKTPMVRQFATDSHFSVKGEGWKKVGHALNKDEDIVKHD